MHKVVLLIMLFLSFKLYTQELMITDGSIDFSDNSIEIAYQKDWADINKISIFSTRSWIELEVKYTNIWDNELNHFYHKLLQILPAEKVIILRDSQRAWLDYFNKEQLFLNDLLIQDFMNGFAVIRK